MRRFWFYLKRLSIVTPRISHIFCSVFASGSPIPFSYFETDERSISSISASCCCVSPLFFLASLKFSEKLICKFPHKIKSAQPKPRTKNTRLDCCDTNPTSQKRRMRKSRYFYTKIPSSFLLIIKLVYVAKILYHLYNKKSSIFSFYAKISRYNNCIDPFFRKKSSLLCQSRQACTVLFKNYVAVLNVNRD